MTATVASSSESLMVDSMRYDTDEVHHDLDTMVWLIVDSPIVGLHFDNGCRRISVIWRHNDMYFQLSSLELSPPQRRPYTWYLTLTQLYRKSACSRAAPKKQPTLTNFPSLNSKIS